MPTTSPFKPAKQVKPIIKALIFGREGIGKTHLALTAPGKIAAIDTEGGTAFFGGRPGITEFDVLNSKTYTEVKKAIEYLNHPKTGYETLVIDPVTVLYEVLQEAARIRRASRKGTTIEDVDLEIMDWTRIGNLYKAMMNAVTSLPMHVIVTAREKDNVERRGSDFTKVGVKADAAKGTGYYFDIIVHLIDEGEVRVAVITKDRLGLHGLNARIVNPTWETVFGPALKLKGKADREVVEDSDAAAVDASAVLPDRTTPALAEAAYQALVTAGRDPDKFLEEKGFESLLDAPPASLKALIERVAAGNGKPTAAVAEE